MTANSIADDTVTTPVPDRQNPYIGPRPFGDNDRERRLFFGRDRESADLLSLVLADRLVLFYAPSGAGKSSLINARLLPALRTEGFALLGTVRVGGQLPEDVALAELANVYVFNLLRDLDAGGHSVQELVGQRLPGYLATVPSDPAQPDRMLIIDQFEELFTTYENQWEKREDFFRQLSQALADDPHQWIMLTIREDYIAELDAYARLLPNRIRVRYRLKYMDAAAALEAVKKPAEVGGRAFAPGVAETLVNNLRQMAPGDAGAAPTLGETVEPVQLQVVCMQLWESLSSRPGATITEADVESLARGAGLGEFVNHALASFYEQTLAAISLTGASVGEREVRDWFSHTLITQDGTRNLLYQSDTETGGLPNTVVLELERRFLLRGETRSGGRWVELVHDRMVAPILEANRQWRRRHPLVIAADLWNADRNATLLINGQALLDAQADLTRNPQRYGAVERHFVAASAEAETKRLEEQQIEQARQKQQAARARVVALGAAGTALLMFLLLLASIWLGIQFLRSSWDARSATENATRERDRAIAAETLANEAAAQAQARATEAVNARKETEQLNRQIRADQLASQAVLVLEQSPQQALLLAVEAMRMGGAAGGRMSHTVEQSIHDVLHATGGIPVAALNGDAVALVLSPDARWFAAATADGALQTWLIEAPDLEPLTLTPPGSAVTWALAASPDGRLAAVGDDGVVRVWAIDAVDSAPAILTADGAPLYTVAFSPDGRWLAAAGARGAVWLWDTAAPTAPPRILTGHTDAVNVVTFSPDGRWLATGGNDAAVWLWPVAEPAPATIVATHAAPVTGLTFSPDGARLASGDKAGGVQVLTLPAPGASATAGAAQPLVGHTASIQALGFSSNSVWLATGDNDGVLRVWNLQDATRGYVVRAYASVISGLAFVVGDNGEKLVTTGYDDPGAASVRVWEYTDVGLAPAVVRGHDGEINLLATAPGVNGFLTAGYDHGVRVWLVDNPHAEPTIVAADTSFVDELAAAPISTTLYAIGGGAPLVQTWDAFGVDPGRTFSSTSESGLTALAASPDGAQFAAGDAAGDIYLWAGVTITPFAKLEGHTGKVNSVALQPGNALLASAGDDGTVRLWDLHGAAAVHILSEGTARPTAVQFNADGAHLAVADSAGAVTVWDVVRADAPRHVLLAGDQELTTVAFSPDGARVAAGDLGGRVWVWELTTPEASPRTWEAHPNEVNTVLFGNDRNQLITTSADRTVRLWNLNDALPIPTVLAGHRASVNSAVNAADMIYSASTDGTLRQWLLAPGELAARACLVAGRNLYQDEWARFLPDAPCRATCPGLPDRCGESSP